MKLVVLEPLLNLEETVNFSVESDREGTVGGKHRLFAGCQINNAQTRVPQRTAREHMNARSVRTAVAQGCDHTLKRGPVINSFGRYNTGDAAHSLNPISSKTFSNRFRQV